MSRKRQTTDHPDYGQSLLAGEQEAAFLLGMSRSHFRRHVAGAVDRVYVGRRVLYSRVALEQWIEREMFRPSEVRHVGRDHKLF